MTAVPGVRREMAHAPDRFKALVPAMERGTVPWPLFVHGPPGTGKTCAALALHDHAGGLYFSADEFVGQAVQAMRGELEWSWRRERPVVTEGGFWAAVAACSLLTLDDLGTRERVSDAAYDRLKRALDSRDGRPTVVVSNLDLDALARVYDDRIASRLAAGTVLFLGGDDRRLQR